MFSKGPAARNSVRLGLPLALRAALPDRSRLLLCRRWLPGPGLTPGGILVAATTGTRGVTSIKAIHPNELRTAVRALERGGQ